MFSGIWTGNKTRKIKGRCMGDDYYEITLDRRLGLLEVRSTSTFVSLFKIRVHYCSSFGGIVHCTTT
jgi:hypothetical protein